MKSNSQDHDGPLRIALYRQMVELRWQFSPVIVELVFEGIQADGVNNAFRQIVPLSRVSVVK